ncbi:MarR family transcriptional regulator [Actinomadura sp. DC4]|uniref:MarR family winged helix-turn-helix transcriptional regulator n=1 Tax=Actinomadura sp. DC4 TaxID=3055069 RepID=UPI0025B07E06|nr:MarR family transcriptional regulator [Actinomadura sp. DC4]MDN3358702.1 MarR family transcriptional regulator [Actinomadura sp. DC4]
MSEYAVERARQIFQARQAGEKRQVRRLAEAGPDAGAEDVRFIGTLHLIHSRLRHLDGWLREEHQLNLTEMHVLSMIPADPAARREAGRGEAAARLAREVELSPSGLTRLVDRLVARGLVARSIDTWDRRVTHLVLTDRGRDIRDAVLPRAVAHIRDSGGDDRMPLERLGDLAGPSHRSADGPGRR